MLQLLLVALLASGVVAKDAVAEPAKIAEKAMPIESAATVSKDAEFADQSMRMPMAGMPMAGMPMAGMQMDRDHDSYRDDHLYLKAKLDGHRPEGPLVARTLHSSIGHGPNIAAQDEIIRFTYSPAYYEPMWVLDYRFLKSGGRRYTRGPGGQILILPRSYKHYKGDGTHDYDSMIEHLRLKLIAEQNQRMREHGFAHQHDRGHLYEDDLLRENGPMQHEHEPILNLERERIHQREREYFLPHEREPIQHRQQEPVHYGPMESPRMERERELLQMEREREQEERMEREREQRQRMEREREQRQRMEREREQRQRMERERQQRERMLDMGKEHLPLYH